MKVHALTLNRDAVVLTVWHTSFESYRHLALMIREPSRHLLLTISELSIEVYESHPDEGGELALLADTHAAVSELAQGLGVSTERHDLYADVQTCMQFLEERGWLAILPDGDADHLQN